MFCCLLVCGRHSAEVKRWDVEGKRGQARRSTLENVVLQRDLQLHCSYLPHLPSTGIILVCLSVPDAQKQKTVMTTTAFT